MPYMDKKGKYKGKSMSGMPKGNMLLNELEKLEMDMKKKKLKLPER